jgi:hypothetical protein
MTFHHLTFAVHVLHICESLDRLPALCLNIMTPTIAGAGLIPDCKG